MLNDFINLIPCLGGLICLAGVFLIFCLIVLIVLANRKTSAKRQPVQQGQRASANPRLQLNQIQCPSCGGYDVELTDKPFLLELMTWMGFLFLFCTRFDFCIYDAQRV